MFCFLLSILRSCGSWISVLSMRICSRVLPEAGSGSAAAPSLSECTESFVAKKRANGEGNIRKRTLSCCLVHCMLSAYGSRYGSAGFTQNIVQLLDGESKRRSCCKIATAPSNLIWRPRRGRHFGSYRAKIIKCCSKFLRNLHAKRNFACGVL